MWQGIGSPLTGLSSTHGLQPTARPPPLPPRTVLLIDDQPLKYSFYTDDVKKMLLSSIDNVLRVTIAVNVLSVMF